MNTKLRRIKITWGNVSRCVLFRPCTCTCATADRDSNNIIHTHRTSMWWPRYWKRAYGVVGEILHDGPQVREMRHLITVQNIQAFFYWSSLYTVPNDPIFRISANGSNTTLQDAVGALRWCSASCMFAETHKQFSGNYVGKNCFANDSPQKQSQQNSKNACRHIWLCNPITLFTFLLTIWV